jgi:hypothetical protein
MPGPTVHYRYTVEWAIAEGLPRPDAEAAADADAGTDVLWPGSRKWSRHFNPTASLFWVPVYFRRAVREASPEYLGRSLHCAQDSIGHGLFGLAHLRYRFGGLERDPDDWARMPERTRERIEWATRRMVRAYVRRTAGRPRAT